MVCSTLEISHALSLSVPFMAELWFHVEGARLFQWRKLLRAVCAWWKVYLCFHITSHRIRLSSLVLSISVSV